MIVLIERVNKDLKEKIDIEAFKRGEFVIADAWTMEMIIRI